MPSINLEVGASSAEDVGVHVHANDILMQTVFEWTPLTKRRKINSVWMDFTALTKSMQYQLSTKIDGVNYKVFQTNTSLPWTVADDDGFLLDVSAVAAHDFKLEIQSLVLEGAPRNIPYEVYYDVLE